MSQSKNVNKNGQKIANWAEYNESLKRRGGLWNIFDAQDVFDNWYETKRKEGQKKRYTYTDHRVYAYCSGDIQVAL